MSFSFKKYQQKCRAAGIRLQSPPGQPSDADTDTVSFQDLLNGSDSKAQPTTKPNEIAAQIVQAAKKRRGEVEPAMPGGVAGMIVAAASKARGE